MGNILSNCYPPSHQRLYALRRLNIQIPHVHHMSRKKELTDADKIELKNLLNDLNQYIEYYGVEVFQKYYVQLWQKNVIEILNSA